MQKDNERFLLAYERKASEGKYAEAVIGLIEDTMTVTFAEIDNFLSSYIETQGSIEMSHPDYANLILWTRMSEPFAKTMNVQ